MAVESFVPLLTSLVGIGVSILLASIPWAYGVHGRLTQIETSLKELLGERARWSDVERRLALIEARESQVAARPRI
jgi:hypothetical protein